MAKEIIRPDDPVGQDGISGDINDAGTTAVDLFPPVIGTNPSTYGLTNEEVRDPNKIQVTISDPSRVVILFGARASGKTMALVRLSRYLKQKGFNVTPDRIFRPSNSTHYKEMCDKFDTSVYSDEAAASTNVLSFMLLRVRDKWGKTICQILEAPGEHYFDDQNVNAAFPRYINNLRQGQNAKTWIFIVEDDWKDASTRNNYAQKICNMQSQISSRDKIIFMCHKADLKPEYNNRGIINTKQFFADIKNQYPGIFTRYMNQNPVTKWFSPYNFDFVVFSAGDFSLCADGSQTYEQSNERYPAMLWKAILKSVKGGW